MRKKYVALAIVLILAAALWAGATFWEKLNRPFNGEQAVWVKIPRGATEEDILDSMRVSVGYDYGTTLHDVWKTINSRVEKAPGAYRIEPHEKILDIARRIKSGSQTPVHVKFNNIRMFDELAPRVASYLSLSPREFNQACDSILPKAGFDKDNFIGAFLPDTYEFYWTASPQSVVERLLNYRNSFWNDERTTRAKQLGVTPQQLTVIASIVDEETANNAEKGTIGRLYLNRLQKGMRLQADPTVKYAVGDFSLRRILQKHLDTQSPYNTYLVDGLPPGPIRMPEKSTIDAILNAPANDYLYMCAKEDFSGSHNFARTLSQHNENARRYREALNAHGIR